jgi:hypothetical protein
MSNKKNKKATLADKADKYVCYQESVQSPEHEMDFFEQVFRDAFHRRPFTLREDFCGTFAVCCEWVKSHRRRTAVGVDLDPEPLKWGKANNLSLLKKAQQDRVRILRQDVRKRNKPKVDILAAQNFSFWLFKTRPELLDYFCIARSNLNQEGIMIMDMMGGGQCYDEDHTDVKTVVKGKKGFKYRWEQRRYNPITHDANCYITFRFNDGSQLKHAFQYQWRFWTIAEVRELLAEAGFRESHVYWEKSCESVAETDEWYRAEEAPSDPSWICYIVAIK